MIGILAVCLPNGPLWAEPVTFAVLASFDGTNGAYPWAGLTQGSDGNFYGTTYRGGPTWNQATFVYGYGTVFKVTPDGQLTSLASFYHTNGGGPRGGLVQAKDGNFYGTTRFGGGTTNVVFPGYENEPGYGTVFQVTPEGALTMLVSFNGTNGAVPEAGLVEGPEGALYGTTRFGGASYGDPRANYPYSSNVSGFGTVFKLATNGTFTTLYSFTPDTKGKSPMCALTLGSDGNFYGQAPDSAYGLVFRMTPEGALTTWVSLNASNGVSTVAPLVQGRDGNLYGVSQAAGVYHHGGVFRLSPDGAQSTVTSFTYDGFPMGAVVEGTDGNLYGGRNGGYGTLYPDGTLYQVSPDGNYTNLFSFDGTNGSYPSSALIQGRDGNFYGTAQGGGFYGAGAIYRLSVPAAAAPKLRTPQVSGNALGLSWSAIAGRDYKVQYRTQLDSGDWTDLGTNVTATNGIAQAVDSTGSDPQRFYRAVLLP